MLTIITLYNMSMIIIMLMHLRLWYGYVLWYVAVTTASLPLVKNIEPPPAWVLARRGRVNCIVTTGYQCNSLYEQIKGENRPVLGAIQNLEINWGKHWEGQLLLNWFMWDLKQSTGSLTIRPNHARHVTSRHRPKHARDVMNVTDQTMHVTHVTDQTIHVMHVTDQTMHATHVTYQNMLVTSRT